MLPGSKKAKWNINWDRDKVIVIMLPDTESGVECSWGDKYKHTNMSAYCCAYVERTLKSAEELNVSDEHLEI